MITNIAAKGRMAEAPAAMVVDWLKGQAKTECLPLLASGMDM